MAFVTRPEFLASKDQLKDIWHTNELVLFSSSFFNGEYTLDKKNAGIYKKTITFGCHQQGPCSELSYGTALSGYQIQYQNTATDPGVCLALCHGLVTLGKSLGKSLHVSIFSMNITEIIRPIVTGRKGNTLSPREGYAGSENGIYVVRRVCM